jgi:uncharacterized membrane protein YdfJ with MMPL/SSD domain
MIWVTVFSTVSADAPGFFIHRPIFAWVIALVIMLAGILTLTKMPIAQYPTMKCSVNHLDHSFVVQ